MDYPISDVAGKSKPIGKESLCNNCNTAVGDTRTPTSDDKPRFPIERFNIIGESDAILDVLRCISVLGQYEAPVLITGETGTGKELAARGLHYGGARAGKPFIAINCATLTDELFASEIFGHKKGAFTDAREDKCGLLAAADGGTLFLDEIDSLPLKSQASLLRFLQDSEYRAVGSETVCESDVRLIASANCDLEQFIDCGDFRRDLYYRLYILSIHMPPLRARAGDVSILFDHFLKQFNHQYELGEKNISNRLGVWLAEHDWPGNVRELENMAHRLYLSCRNPTIDVVALPGISRPDGPRSTAHSATPGPGYTELLQDYSQNQGPGISETPGTAEHTGIPAAGSNDFDFSRDKKIAVENFEKQYVASLLQYTSGNVTRAAKLCGKERRALGKLVKKYDLKCYSNAFSPTD